MLFLSFDHKEYNLVQHRSDHNLKTFPKQFAIGYEAFYACSNLESIVIPNSVKTIGENAFASCKKLKIIQLSANISSIGKLAFAWCDSLTDINFSGSKSQWKKLNKDEDWNYELGNYIVHCTDGILNENGI